MSNLKQKEIILLFTRKVLVSLSIFITIVSFSTFGYMIIEKWNFIDSLYMAIVTLSTVGFMEVHNLSNLGRIHTMVVILVGVGFFSSTILYFASFILEGKIRNFFKMELINNRINKISNHYILCGYGRIGQELCNSLINNKNDFIVIEKNKDPYNKAIKKGYLAINNDATLDESLSLAKIEKAKGIICLLDDDALNVFVTLSAKSLNPSIYIISRANSFEAISKLEKVGANQIISPYLVSAKKVSSIINRPNAINFLDNILHNKDFDMNLEEIIINKNYQNDYYLLIKSIDVKILALIKRDKTIITSLENMIFEKDDIIIAIGSNNNLKNLYELFK